MTEKNFEPFDFKTLVETCKEKTTEKKEKKEKKRYYLSVSYEKKEYAKSRGCRFDGEEKLWYLESNDISSKQAYELFDKFELVDSRYLPKHKRLSKEDLKAVKKLFENENVKCYFCEKTVLRKKASKMRPQGHACTDCMSKRCNQCYRICTGWYCGCID